MNQFKKIFKKIFRGKKNKKDHYLIFKWIKEGKPLPPPHVVKQIIIKNERDKSSYNTLIETGTYLGEMVEVQKKNFKKVYSIELGKELYSNAVKRFKDDRNVVILQGDSGIILKKLMTQINEPAIFWLDGHYSEGITAKGEKECPIFEELTAIFASRKLNHKILVDDARLFNGTKDYPTINELMDFIKDKGQNFDFILEDDIIRISLLS